MSAERFIDRRMSRRAAVGIGLGRAALSAVVLVRPTAFPRALGFDEESARRYDWLLRMFAVRDAALGLGAAWVALRGGPLRPWLVAQAAGDATDAIVFAAGARGGRLPAVRGYGGAAFAAAGVVGDLALAAAED